MTAAEREERDREVAQQNRNDLSSMLELRDIVDELGTIMKLLEQQTTTINDMVKYFEHRGYGKRFILASLARLDEYRTHISEMKGNAIAAQKAVCPTSPKCHTPLGLHGIHYFDTFRLTSPR